MMTQLEPYVESRVYMDTIVTIQVPQADSAAVTDRVERAFGWFREVEAHCSRFDPESELRVLCRQPGIAVKASPLMFRALAFAVAVAVETDGAFDPTVGLLMEQRGFNRNYRTGAVTTTSLAPADVSYRDVLLNAGEGTVTITRPLLIDLGAVAKGLAIDLAAAELRDLDGFLINAGGDVFVHGRDQDERPWRIGVKDPADPVRLISVLTLTDGAVCTSGGYERPTPSGEGHHIVLPTSGESPRDIAGVTVVAASAMVADALSTAAFVLGRDEGLALLERQQAEGMIIDETGRMTATAGLREYL